MSGTGRWGDDHDVHISLEEIDEDGRVRLRSASAVVIGAGPVGTCTAEQLLRTGLGRLTIVDGGCIRERDLGYSGMLGPDHLGRPKAAVLAEALKESFPDARVKGIEVEMTPENVTSMIRRTDVVVDGLDDMGPRLVLNDACLELDLPWVMGLVVGNNGMVVTFPQGGPCLQCVYPKVMSEPYLDDPRVVGVDPATVALASEMQASEAAKVVLGVVGPPAILVTQSGKVEWSKEEFETLETCPACVEGRRKFLSPYVIKTVTTLCGQDAVQISPHQRANLDLDVKAKELDPFGRVVRSRGMLKLELEDAVIYLFESGRALIKGTTDPLLAKRLYGKYVGL